MNKNIVSLIGEAATYEQLAEECTELAKACLKMSRIIRGENPTPVTREEAYELITEEFTDVVQCALILGLNVDYSQMIAKNNRWRERIEKKEK